MLRLPALIAGSRKTPPNGGASTAEKDGSVEAVVIRSCSWLKRGLAICCAHEPD